MTGAQVIQSGHDLANRFDRIGDAIGADLPGTDEAKAEWHAAARIIRRLIALAELKTVAAANVETGVVRAGVH